MHYILNADNYISAISFGCDIECADGYCQEYTGGIPTGYTSLDAWYAAESEKLYRWKIVNGQLTVDADAVAPAPDKLPYAPAGYGLGGAVQYLSWADIDSYTERGWFNFTGSDVTFANITCSNGYLEVAGFNASWLTQKLHLIIGGGTNYTLMRDRINGVWGEWEWENPPMVPGFEYRTTERWNNKAIYAKCVDCGYMPRNDTKYVAHGVVSTATYTSVRMVFQYKGTACEAVKGGGDAINISEGNIKIVTNWSAGDYRVYAFLKYVKE